MGLFSKRPRIGEVTYASEAGAKRLWGWCEHCLGLGLSYDALLFYSKGILKPSRKSERCSRCDGQGQREYLVSFDYVRGVKVENLRPDNFMRSRYKNPVYVFRSDALKGFNLKELHQNMVIELRSKITDSIDEIGLEKSQEIWGAFAGDAIGFEWPKKKQLIASKQVSKGTQSHALQSCNGNHSWQEFRSLGYWKRRCSKCGKLDLGWAQPLP